MQADNTLVVGAQGTGKTTYLRQLHASFKGQSAFLTTKKGETKAAYDPPRRLRKSPASYPTDLKAARQWAREERGPTQIIVDEAQNAPSFRVGDGPVRDGLHQDREAGVRWVIATQSPQDLHTSQNAYGPIQQCTYFIWVGPPNSWHDGFIRHHGLDGVLPTELYRFHVIRPTRPPRVVFRGRTNPEYG